MRHCVVTGGADGIGRAVVEQYARLGFAVTIIDRDLDRGAELCAALQNTGTHATAIHADLTQPAQIELAVQRLSGLPPIDILVHSAGISAVGVFAESDLQAQQAVLDVNLQAPLLLTNGVLHKQLIAKGGCLVFIASLSVFTGYPGAAVYAASKDGIAAYARSLRVSLAQQRIHVLTVFPGPTRTAHARRYSPDNRREQRRMPPEQLAHFIALAIDRHATTLIPGPANKLVALLGRIMPFLTEELMRRTIFTKLTR